MCADVIPNGNLFLSTAKIRFFGCRPQNDDLRQIGLTKSEQLLRRSFDVEAWLNYNDRNL